MAPLLVENVRFAFQPLINLKTGGIVAIEVLPHGNVPDLVREALQQRQLRELDWWLAVSAVRAVAETESLLPLHINVLATTIAHDRGGIDWLSETVHEIGRRAQEVTIEVGTPFDTRESEELVTGIQRLRDRGFRIALEGVGHASIPLTLIADIRPDIVKLAPEIVRRLTSRPEQLAVLESLRHLCKAVGATLLAHGVDNERQLAVLRHNDVRLVQGDLLARAARRPPTTLSVPGIAAETDAPDGLAASPLVAGPRVTEFLSPATLLPAEVLADDVRQVFADQPDISGVVLVDERNCPQWTIERNRFLLAVTGPYGHSLHAKRPAARLADEPLLVTTSTTAVEALHLLTEIDRRRSYDDAVVVDEAGHCLGVVQAGILIRGMAELKAELATSLNPLTRLPGSDSVAEEVARRIGLGAEFAVGWLDIDKFKTVNDTAGFSAGDAVIRSVGRSLTDAAASLDGVRVAHVGGDDFLLVADPDTLAPLAAMVLDPPRETHGLSISLSLASLICRPDSVTGYDDVSQRLAPLKRHAKSMPGPSWVQARPGTEGIEVLRGESEVPGLQRRGFPPRRPDSAEPPGERPESPRRPAPPERRDPRGQEDFTERTESMARLEPLERTDSIEQSSPQWSEGKVGFLPQGGTEPFRRVS